MSYCIYITRAAERDIAHAADYIEFSLMNARAAADLMNDVTREIGALAEHPARFQVVDDPVLAGWGIRYCMVRSHLAFYTIDEDRSMVIIVRFLYEHSNWQAILRQGVALN